MVDEMRNGFISFTEITQMGTVIAKSGLFGITTPEQAIALMLVAQAEGRHPASVAQDYNVIKNRPALKADTILARFIKVGGRVEWGEYTDAKVSAVFSHPSGGRVKVEWDDSRVKRAQLEASGMHAKYPRQMKRARVISEGVRTVFPGVCCGVYTYEEIEDMGDDASALLRVSSKPVVSEVVTDAAATTTSAEPTAAVPAEKSITRAQVKKIYSMCSAKKIDKDHIKAWLLGSVQVASMADLPESKFERLCKTIEEKPGFFAEWVATHPASGPTPTDPTPMQRDPVAASSVMDAGDFAELLRQVAADAGYTTVDAVNEALDTEYGWKIDTIPAAEQSAVIDFFTAHRQAAGA